MKALHFLHRGINKAFSPLGLAVKIVEPTPWRRPKSAHVKVAGHSIEIPTHNPLSKLYITNPGYTSFLGRLAGLIEARYPGSVAIDIGANVGDTACIIRSGAPMPIICIEGDATSFAYLRRNLSQLQHCEAHQVFLGEKSGTIQVTIQKEGWNNTLIPTDTTQGKSVDMLTLSDFVDQHSAAQQVKLLKIDTEGFDCAIIRSGMKFLETARPVVSFEYNRDNMAALNEDGLATLRQLWDIGYSGVAVHDCGGRYFSAFRLNSWEEIQNLHDYADGSNAAVYYFDYTLFHETDESMFQAFVGAEKEQRV